MLHANDQGVTFEVHRDGQRLLGPSRLGCELVGRGSLGTSVSVADAQQKNINETFQLPWGKTKQVTNECNAAEVKLVENTGIQWQVDLRAYDDGVAFRYRLVEQEELSDIAIRDEATTFDVAGQPIVLFNSLEGSTEPNG